MIQNPRIAVLISMGLSLLVLPFVSFNFKAHSVPANVLSVEASNARCGRARSLFSRDCTRYHAKVEFQDRNSIRREATVYAGQVKGYNQPLIHADVQPGRPARVLYHASETEVRVDEFWNRPIGAIFLVLLTFGLSLLSFMLRRWGFGRH